LTSISTSELSTTTKKGHPRTIPLSGRALAILQARRSGMAEDERIFPTTEDAVKMAWRRIMGRIRLPDFRFHDLRHEAISRFFEAGLSVPEVALLSGHRDPRMTSLTSCEAITHEPWTR
jgi:integrase